MYRSTTLHLVLMCNAQMDILTMQDMTSKALWNILRPIAATINNIYIVFREYEVNVAFTTLTTYVIS